MGVLLLIQQLDDDDRSKEYQVNHLVIGVGKKMPGGEPGENLSMHCSERGGSLPGPVNDRHRTLIRCCRERYFLKASPATADTLLLKVLMPFSSQLRYSLVA
jgi:hypothetical protein